MMFMPVTTPTRSHMAMSMGVVDRPTSARRYMDDAEQYRKRNTMPAEYAIRVAKADVVDQGVLPRHPIVG